MMGRKNQTMIGAPDHKRNFMSPVYLGKIWQTKNFCLCFEINEKSLPRKSFLLIQTKSKKILISPKKPSDLLIQGQISNLLRKHLSGKYLNSIQETQINKEQEFWLLFCKRSEISASYYLRIKPQQGMEVSLIQKENSQTIFRYNSKGTYTRIKCYEGKYPEEQQEKNLYSSYVEKFKLSLETQKESSEPQIIAKEEKSSLQQEVSKKLKRKLKTLQISLTKLKEQTPTKKEIENLEEQSHQLQNNLYLVKEGTNQLTLGEEQGFSQPFIITLDPLLNLVKI